MDAEEYRRVTEMTYREKLVPRFLDRLLARNAYQSQQTDEPVEADRQYNLWGPVAGDHGAHGPFDDRAKQQSEQLWLTTHRKTVGLLGVIVYHLLGTFLRVRADAGE